MKLKWPRRKRYGHPRLEFPIKNSLGETVMIVVAETDKFRNRDEMDQFLKELGK